MNQILFFVLAIIVETCQCSELGSVTYPIYSLRPLTGSRGQHGVGDGDGDGDAGGDGVAGGGGISCSSWRVGVEAHNVIEWKSVPKECEEYVANYMVGNQYREDSKVIVEEAIRYAKSLNLSKDGRSLWIFDVDETSLSNLPYFTEQGFGVKPYNRTLFNIWITRAIAPALPETLKLYRNLLFLGIKVAFITGRTAEQRNVTVKNLKKAGYPTWEAVILRESVYLGETAVLYKSTQRGMLEMKGYDIVGNIGDQWSDLLGDHAGRRTFKLPDPMYYIS